MAVTIDLMPKLKKNVLNFRYGVNFKYKGMLTHSFDVVTKYEIPRVEQLQFTTFAFDLTSVIYTSQKVHYIVEELPPT